MCPWRASGSTVEMIRPLATPRTMRKDPVVALFGVLAGDEGQQLGRPGGPGWKRLPVDGTEGGQGVAHQGVDEGLAGSLVVPVAGGLTHGVVGVVADEGGSDAFGQGTPRLIEGDEELADHRAQLGDGVLGGHGVMERGRVEDAGPGP